MFAFYSPGPPLGSSPKKCGLILFWPRRRENPPAPVIRTREGEPIAAEPLRHIGPGHPPGRDPERTAATVEPPAPIAAAGIGRCPARCRLSGRLAESPVARCAWSTP